MIELPNGVVPTAPFAPYLIDFGGYQQGPLGGAMLRVDRPGNRYGVAVTLPPLVNMDMGRVVVSRLIRAKVEGLRLRFPLAGVDQGSPGTPRINGGGQAGSTIVIDGCRPGYGVSEGYWLAIETGGRRYLYNVAAPAQANGAGQMAIAIAPPLRKPPTDNDPVFLQRPTIEGAILGDKAAWEISLARHAHIQFELQEVR